MSLSSKYFKRIKIAFVFFIITISILVSSNIIITSCSDQKNDYYSCLEYYREKNYNKAINAFTEYLQVHPDNSFAYKKLFNVYKDAGKLEQADLFFKSLTNKYPQSAYPHWSLGLVYTESGEDDKAIELFKKSINLQPEFAGAYKDLASSFKNVNEFQNGVSFFNQLTELQQNNPAPYYGLASIYNLELQWENTLYNLEKAAELKPDFLDAFILQIKVLRKTGKYEEALKMCQQASTIAIKIDDIEAQGMVKGEYANIYLYLGNIELAQKYAEEAIEIFQKTVNKTGELAASNIVGLVFRNSGKFDRALEIYNRNLEIDRELKDRYGEEIDLGNIGDIYTESADYKTALNYYQIALKIAVEIDDRIGEAINLGAISTVYAYQGDYERSIAFSKKAIKIHLETGYKSGECNDLGNLGLTYMELGEYTKSIEYQNQALKVAYEIDEKYKIHTGLGNLGSIYLLIGNHQKALDYTKRAKSTADEMNDVLYSAIWMSQLAEIKIEMGNLSGALNEFNKALSSFIEIGDQRNEALTYSNIANIQFKLNIYSEAESYFKKALDINQKIGNRYSLGQTHINLAGFYVEIGDLEKAIQSYTKGLKIGEALRIPEMIWKANYGIGLINQKSGEYSIAKDHYKKAIQTFEKIRGNILTGEQKSYFFESKIRVYKNLIDLLFRDYKNNKDIRILEESFYYAEHAKARTLLDILFESNIKVNKDVNPKLIDKQSQIFRNISRIRTDLLKNDIGQNQQQKLYNALNTEEENLGKLQLQLKMENPAYANLNYPEPSRLSEIQKSLIGENDLLLEYSLSEPNSFLWAISKDNASFFKLPGEKDIGDNVNKYLSIISKPPTANQTSYSSGKQLYKLLLDPAQSILKQNQNLMIVPDGILHYLPFESLIVELEKNLPVYLVEKYNIRYAPSASVMKVIKQDNQNTKLNQEMELVAFGDPVFNAGNRTNEIIEDKNLYSHNNTEIGLYENSGFNFRRLPYTGLEVKNITSLFKREKVSLNLRENASEENFKAMNPINSRIIHFATHGLLDEKHPKRSCIVLTLDDNPAEDGFLQMNEIFNLNINAELVVLSACQTGRGKLLQGEGVIGLTQAFLYAGVRSVIVSLWTVNDRSTSEIMSKFYKYLKQDVSFDEALRKAKNDLLKGKIASLHHPYYWAPFIFIGNSY